MHSTQRAAASVSSRTSGNTGIAYAWIGAALGVPVTLVMPENVSAPRKQVTAAYGTELIFSDPMEGSDGAIVLARQLVEQHGDRYYYPNQYANPNNPLAHYCGTAPDPTQTVGREPLRPVSAPAARPSGLAAVAELAPLPGVRVICIDATRRRHVRAEGSSTAQQLIPA
jgi:cysteine synthase B